MGAWAVALCRYLADKREIEAHYQGRFPWSARSGRSTQHPAVISPTDRVEELQ